MSRAPRTSKAPRQTSKAPRQTSKAPRRTFEEIDVVDVASGEVIATRPRDEVHRDAQWHQVFHCMLVCRARSTLVFQERALTKVAFPGLLDLSVTGHLRAGERPIDGVREAEEELGVTIDPEQLVSLGIRLLVDDNGEGRNRERVHVFFLDDDRPLDTFAPPLDEVSALVEVGIEDFLHVLADPTISMPARRFDVASGELSDASMSRDALVEGTSGYWVVLAVMAARFARGEELLAV